MATKHRGNVTPGTADQGKAMAGNSTFDPIRLRLARVRAGLTQAELGALIGASASHVSRYECGRTQPSVKSLAKLAAALKVPPGALLTATEDAERKLSDLRVAAGLTQADVATALALNDRNYSAIERGELGLTPAVAQLLAEAFSVTVDQVTDSYVNARRQRRARGMRLQPLRAEHVRSPEEPAVPRIAHKGPRPFTPPPGYQ